MVVLRFLLASSFISIRKHVLNVSRDVDKLEDGGKH